MEEGRFFLNCCSGIVTGEIRAFYFLIEEEDDWGCWTDGYFRWLLTFCFLGKSGCRLEARVTD